ncbi:MAG: SsrA-binding protein [Bacteroidetes bacterium 4572_112]|nr:MAG: SsrA-binding protein [Bacteroidetes bacterium 4572_112]
MKAKIEIKNKRASYEYFLSDHITAGIVLSGTEIKSIRMSKANISDAYGAFINGELYIKNMFIAEYAMGSYNRHETRTERKLLLNKRELKKFAIKTKEKGFTIVPTLLFINDKGLAKLEIALAKGKQHFDKRNTIKDKDLKRDMDRMKL